MIWLMTAVSAVFLGPFAVVYILTAIQIKRLEQEERKLAKINELEQRYGIEISNADLTMRCGGDD